MPETRIRFRLVEDADIPQLLEIYLYYIRNSTATFQIGDIGEAEMRRIVLSKSFRYHSYAIMDGQTLCGYALYARYREREAFVTTAEITIYLKDGYGGRGIGLQAICLLESTAKSNGIHSLVALICHENAASIRLFEKAGYQRQGRIKEAGFKFGRFLDLLIFQKQL